MLRRRHTRMRFPVPVSATEPFAVLQESDLAKRQRIEGTLFLGREPMPSGKLAQYADLKDGNESRTIVRHLNEQYDQTGRAFRVEEVGGGFQLMTRPVFSQWLRRFEHIPNTKRLSSPAMETLSVIAYEQPATRADVEAIRGVGCGEVLRQLMERDMVKIAGRSDDLGRPYIYATTRKFLQAFGLTSLEELPEIKHSPVLLNALDDEEDDSADDIDEIEELDDDTDDDSDNSQDDDKDDADQDSDQGSDQSSDDFDDDDLEELEDDDWDDEDDEDEEGDEGDEGDEDGDDDQEGDDDDGDESSGWEEVEDDDDDDDDDESGWEDDYDDLDDKEDDDDDDEEDEEDNSDDDSDE